ncbi:uncharacterized protein [Mytilus edulis]|uniref:uncharacterized protein n=1 Tax=Mytilus edulis TaxID=6550 RepID=UPI0039EED4C8
MYKAESSSSKVIVIDTRMTTDLSQPLYDYLCKKIGTEDIVKVRRLCYAIFEYLFAITPANSYFSWISSSLFFTYIYSGSKADGLDLKGSDTDIMCVFHCVNVFENPLYKLGTFSCHTSTEYTKRGFVRLKPNFLVALLAPFYCKQRDGQVFLSSELVKTMAIPLIRRYLDVFIHGPCITTADEANDIAVCLRSKSWIAQAQPWVFRNRLWPSYELVSQIVDYGVLFVPIGSKGSQNEDIEWRVSFSVAEKHLVYSFTHVQLLSYALLKILLKEVIDLSAICKGLLCSYFIKTLIFWILEEEMSSLKQQNCISYFNRLIFRLRYYVKVNFLPHYFISEYNLFENRFCSKQQQTLVDLLTDIYQKGIFCFLNSETLSDFFGTNLSTWTYFTGFDYELISTAISILNDCLMFDVSPNTLVVLFSRYKLVSHRYLYTLYWCAVCQHIGHKTIGIQERSNKDQYKRYKTYLPYLVMGLQKDAITGWLCLASYFFSVHNYKTCLILIEYILHKCCFEESSDAESHIGRVNNLEIEAIKYGVGNAHDICSRHFVDLTTKFQLSCQVRPEKIQLETVINLRAISSPFVYTHFLRFMCCHHLRDFNGVPYALRDLQRLISKHQFDATFCLGLAYATLKEYATAMSLLLSCSRGLKSSNNSEFANLIIELDLVINKLKRASS